VPHTGTGSGIQLNARLYDVFPDGKAVMVDRGVRRVPSANATTIFDLNGNGWLFQEGHRIRIELAQDDDPYMKQSTQPSSLTLTGLKLRIPVRQPSATINATAVT
ncbi:MAG TPA: CocE/NonD family hydrolase C-terminal non-catalytic domain-containing protein, partial [Actinomycetota bacterium]|nr:CocE/NonD family hydrolase C-terminal non-catalytic domain-containing protein [Actinomycetota bacterium]